MYLPTFPRRMAAVRHVQTDFRGYDHRPSCPEGGIYEMTNGSAADSPLFSTRPGRTRIYPCSGTPYFLQFLLFQWFLSWKITKKKSLLFSI